MVTVLLFGPPLPGKPREGLGAKAKEAATGLVDTQVFLYFEHDLPARRPTTDPVKRDNKKRTPYDPVLRHCGTLY